MPVEGSGVCCKLWVLKSTKLTTLDIIATYSKLITSSLSKSIERCQMSSSEEPTVHIYIQVLKNNKNAVYDY